MKKFLSIILIFLALANPVFAATNTKSIDLETDSSQYVSITDAAQTGLDFSEDFTIEWWQKWESYSTATVYSTLSKFMNSGQKSYLIRFFNNEIYLNISDDGVNSSQKNTALGSLSAGIWYHFAVVFDGSTGTADIYIDNVAKTQQTGHKTSIHDGTDPVYIGIGNGIFDGKFDEYIMWNDVRTSGEISASYNSGNGKVYTGSEAGMAAYWRFEDDLLDETSNNNDLTNNNSATFSTDVPWSGEEPAAVLKRESEWWIY